MSQTPRLFWVARLVFLMVLLPAGEGVVRGQQPGTISGTVVRARGDESLAGVNVVVVGTLHAAVTGEAGDFSIGPVPPGRYTLQVDVFSYQVVRQTVEVGSGQDIVVRFRLEAEDVELETVAVTATRPATQPVAELPEDRLQERYGPALGAMVRALPGVEAGRLTALAVAPNVRGLGGPRLGVYVDGLRLFAVEPYEGDSPLGYLDPLFVDGIEVVKGPYALTWGGGMMSAVRVQTRTIDEDPSRPLQGTFQAGYGTNIGALETAGHVWGGKERWAYGLQAAYRAGHDYEDGDDLRLEGDYGVGTLRGQVAHSFGPSSRLHLMAGYQEQQGADVPGDDTEVNRRRMGQLAARFQAARAEGLWRSVEVLAAWGGVMQERGGGTTVGDIDTEQTQLTGRVAAQLEPSGSVTLEVGGEVYSVYQDVTRQAPPLEGTSFPIIAQVVRQDVGVIEAGAFVQGRHTGGPLEVSASMRVDRVHAEPGRLQGALDGSDEPLLPESAATGVVWSGALALSRDLSPAWTASAGIGSVARVPGIHERYTGLFFDRLLLPVAIVLGNPALDPERSTQADIWVEGTFSNLELRFDGFGRRLRNYIYWEPLPTNGPLSIWRPVNGTATFFGLEATLGYHVLRDLSSVQLTVAYLWGQEETRNRPLAAVAPAAAALAWRLNAPANLFFVELSLHGVARQQRVAQELGEAPSDGYILAAFRFGLALPRRTSLLIGLDNMTDAAYAPHLNGAHPVPRVPLSEPGRVAFLRLRHDF